MTDFDERDSIEPRIDYQDDYPDALEGLLDIEKFVASSSLNRSLVELVKLRASQINGCAYCIDMHTKEARAAGESEQRLYGLSAWHETPFYSDRERAALAWTEAVTTVSDSEISDDLYQAVRDQFTEAELVTLTMAIIAINGWNRLAISFRTVPGTYEPQDGKG